MPITKLADILIGDALKAIAAGYAVVGGTGVAKNQFSKGNITGRQTVYHGTTPDKKRSILSQGLKATSDKSAVNTKVLKDRSPDLYEKSMGKSYFTPSKLDAAGYAAGAEYRPKGMEPGLKHAVKSYITGKGIVKANLPTWKMDTVRNPEVDMGFKNWVDGLPTEVRDLTPDKDLKALFNQVDRVVVVEGDTPTKYIKGGEDYSRAGAREIFDFIKNNKLQALRGNAIAAAGLVPAAIGGYHLLKK